MAFLRKRKASNFTTISNTALKDNELSFKAKGLLAYMWSLPDDWAFYETELAKRSTDRLASVRSGLKELEDKGYLVKQRARNDKGQMTGNDWLISDEPEPNFENQILDEPECDYPNLENPSLENPSLDNRTLLNTNITKDLSLPITNDTNSPAVAEPVPVKSKKNKPVRHKYGEFENVLLADIELEKIKSRFPDWQRRIDDLSFYIGSKGVTYKDHYKTILNWARKDEQRNGRAQFSNLSEQAPIIRDVEEFPF